MSMPDMSVKEWLREVGEVAVSYVVVVVIALAALWLLTGGRLDRLN
jgi:hypothetical protein